MIDHFPSCRRADFDSIGYLIVQRLSGMSSLFEEEELWGGGGVNSIGAIESSRCNNGKADAYWNM